MPQTYLPAFSNPPAEVKVQALVHSLSRGRLRESLQLVLLLGLGGLLGCAYLGLFPMLPWQYRGFSVPAAMDQAQVGRELARGHGYTTLFVRPLAVWQLSQRWGHAPRAGQPFPELSQPPLGPLVDSVALRLSLKRQPREFRAGDPVSLHERVIAGAQMAFFLGALLLQYLLLRRLFDHRLALLTVAVMLWSDYCWRFSLTGLPQMLLLFLFHAALYALTSAVQVRLTSRPTWRIVFWNLLAGIAFGFMTLTNGLAAAVFVGAWLFALAYFRGRRVLGPLAMLLAFGLVVAPWLWRNYQACGQPLGLNGYTLLAGGEGAPDGAVVARVPGAPPAWPESLGRLAGRLLPSLAGQVRGFDQQMGGSLLAAAFFVALLYPFKRPLAGVLRWPLLGAWVGAVAAMAVEGAGSGGPGPLADPFRAGQLHVLFLPMMTAYGLAFGLVLFSRLPVAHAWPWRLGVLGLLFAGAALPVAATLSTRPAQPVQYPPYVPQNIARLAEMTGPDETIAADMPWAVAWYADRRSVWIPLQVRSLLALDEAGQLPGHLAGIFLTGTTRDTPFGSSILEGPYRDWAGLILGASAAINARGFPFYNSLPMDFLMTFYSDRRRWDQTPAAPAATAPAPTPTPAAAVTSGSAER